MPYATGLGLQQINPGLSNLSVKYANDRAGYVFPKLPTVQVSHETDEYYIFGRESFQIPQTIRANKGAANRSEYTLSIGTYSLDRHSLDDIVTDRERNNANKGINPDVDTMELLTDQIMNRMEYDAATAMFTSTSWNNSGSLTSTLYWTLNSTTTDVIGDVQSMTTVIMQKTGKPANTLVIGKKTYNAVRNQVNILDRIKYSERGIITPELLASVLDINNLIIGTSVYDAGIEGSATPSTTWIWDTKALAMYLEPNAKLKSPSAMYNLQMAVGEYPYAVKKYRDDKYEGDVIEVNAFHKTKVTGADAGYILSVNA